MLNTRRLKQYARAMQLNKPTEELQEMLDNRRNELINPALRTPEIQRNLLKNIIKLECEIEKRKSQPWSMANYDKTVANTIRRRCRK